MIHKTDVSLITSAAQTILSRWEAGEDICIGLGDTPDFRTHDSVCTLERVYPTVNENAFKAFSREVLVNVPDGSTEQFVSFLSVGYTKNGIRLRATITALKPAHKRISGTRA